MTAYDAAGNWASAVIAINYSPGGSEGKEGLSLEIILPILAIIVTIMIIVLSLLRRSRRGG